MRSIRFAILLVFLIIVSLTVSGYLWNDSYASDNSESASLPPYDPTVRGSSYTLENRSMAPYPTILMSAQSESQYNEPLINGEEEALFFNLTTHIIEKTFTLPPNETFLAIDGCSQSDVLRVNYTVFYPNNSIATGPITTLATGTQHLHLFIVDPPAGTWRIESQLIDEGDTTAWLQAISSNNGARMVANLEKEQMHLSPGQSLYYTIPLYTSDWFYLYINRFANAYIQVNMSKEGSYNIPYRSYSYTANPINELFLSSTSTPGLYLLDIINRGDTDIFVEIVKSSGVTQNLNVDSGRLVQSRFRYDLEFFKATITESYDWLAFDGAVSATGTNTRFLIINPNLSIIYDSVSSSPTDFNEKMVANNTVGDYYVGIFGNENASATIKITSSNSVESISPTKLDQNWNFTQSGQTFYLEISQNQNYFLFAGFQNGSNRGIKYTLFNPSLTQIWSSQPTSSQPYVLYPPQKPTVPYYILKLQGQTQNSSMIHLRFQGQEDYNIATPDSSIYWSRFGGDIVIANISVRNSNYVLQHIGSIQDSSYVALFDQGNNQKLSRSFSSPQQTYLQRWRQGFENPTEGNWLQVFIDTGTTAAQSAVQVSTLQSGDETQQISTPFQLTQAVTWNTWWKVETYKINVDSTDWFGIVSKLAPVNNTYPYHPYSSIWVYDSLLNEFQSGETVSASSNFAASFWPNPRIGSWLIVLVGFQHSPYSMNYDPLNCSVSFVGDADFHRDWPSNLQGNLMTFDVTVGDSTYPINTLSNSTISDLSFDPQIAEISMTVTGTEGTESYGVISVPKQLADIPFAAYIDAQPANNVLSTENDTHVSVYLPFKAGNHQLSLVMTASDKTPPVTSNNYDGAWHTSNFAVTLASNDISGVFETYYRNNNGPIQTTRTNGQPSITLESNNNKIEYWSTDLFGNEELPHRILTNIKLDKTPPTGSLLINNGEVYTNSPIIELNINANDSTSGISQLRFTEDGFWDTELWEEFTTTKTWTLALGDGPRTIFGQVKDNADLTSAFSDSIILDTIPPIANAGKNQTVTKGTSVSFDASQSSDYNGIINYIWDFGDGTAQSGKTASHTYTNQGQYVATLTVQDPATNTATSTVTITIESEVIPEFSSRFLMPILIILTLASLTINKKLTHKKHSSSKQSQNKDTN